MGDVSEVRHCVSGSLDTQCLTSLTSPEFTDRVISHICGKTHPCLVTIGSALERTVHTNADVVGLLLGQLGELGAAVSEVQRSNLLVEGLWQQVHVVLVGLGLLPVL